MTWLVALLAWLVLAAPAAAFELPYTLTQPAGPGPFPAVVILHDCSGLGPRSSRAPFRWAAELTARGYVTIWPDSFTARGKPAGVCVDPSQPRIPYETRAKDAWAAVRFLRTLPQVDGSRIAVMGGSHGGASTLETVVAGAREEGEEGLRAAVALYPNCGQSIGGWRVRRIAGQPHVIAEYIGVYAPRVPVLILTGALDDWTPAEPCRQLAATAKAAGHPVEIIVYDGAHHAFDSNTSLRFNPERLNGYSPIGRGATTAGNAEAWADAVVQVTQFLAARLGN